MRRVSVLTLVAVFAAGPLAAQGGINLRLAQGQSAKYVPPLCPLKTMNSKVDKAVASLRKAYEAKAPADKGALLADAKQNLAAAITQESQSGNGAAWYFLARVALLQGDPAGVDSAFTKAQALAPACEIDISQYRQNSWALLGQAGVEMQKKGQMDSAMVQFRDASLLFRGLPHVYTNMGVMFANTNHDDSAAVYFAKALEIAQADSTLTEDRNSVALNLSIMYQRLNKNAEAIALLHKYLKWKHDEKAVRVEALKKAGKADSAAILERTPDDPEAQKQLIIAFRSAGMEDSANALQNAVVAQFSTQNPDSLDSRDLMDVGVAAFNAQKYDLAEIDFKKAVQRNPWGRDARYNLANTYLAIAKVAGDSADVLRKAAKAKNPSDAVKAQLADTVKLDATAAAANTKLVEQAGKLIELEPMNEDNLRLLAQGQRALKQDAVYKTAERLVGLPFSVEVTLFQIGQSNVRFAGEATGRSPQDAAGKPIKPAPVTLVFEFVNVTGEVVDTKEIAIPVLTSGQKQAIQLEGKGSGISGWRYKVKAG